MVEKSTQKSIPSKWLIISIVVIIAVFGSGAFLLWGGLSKSNLPQLAVGKSNNSKTLSPLQCVEKLPDSQKIGQKLMVAGFKGQLATGATELDNLSIGGVILMNETPASEITEFKKQFKVIPFIAVDQEGGTVQRYNANGPLLGETAMATDKTENQAFQLYLENYTYLKSVGIDTIFAPVVDVLSAQSSPLPGRMYASDPIVVTSYASQAVKAAKQLGLNPVIKHFPGLGSTKLNTDYGVATTDDIAILKSRDLLPYKDLSSLAPDVMVSSAIVPGLTDGQPALWSKQAIDLLRSYGYQQSVVYSDSLTAQAVPGDLYNAILKTWQAGVDVALIVQAQNDTSFNATISAIIDELSQDLKDGRLDQKQLDASLLRILNQKQVDACQISSQ